MENNIKRFEKVFNALAGAKEKNEEKMLLLNQIIEMLAAAKPSLVITVLGKTRCAKCKKLSVELPSPLTKMSCVHSICISCLRTQVILTLNDKGDERLISQVRCPKCEELIPVEIIRKVFNQEELNKLIRKYALSCMCEGALENLGELSCGHKVCIECFGKHLDACISGNHITDENLCCQVKACRKPLHAYEIANILRSYNKDGTLMKQLARFSLRNFRPINKEKIYWCKRCDDSYQILPEDNPVFDCPTCGDTFCGGCGNNLHPGKFCWEQEADSEERKTMIEQGRRYCPSCNTLCCKPEGCEYIRCTSAMCREKKMFCYLCGMKLTERDHYSHFYNEPFKGMCKLLP